MKTHSVDIHPKYNPSTTTDILEWDYKPVMEDFLSGASSRDVVWVHASPPCTEYSVAKTTGVRNFPLADKLVRRSLHIIKFCRGLCPEAERFFWSLENPVGHLRARPFMQRLLKYRNSTSYCQWGKPFRKNTDIWTNTPNLDLPVCSKNEGYCAAKASLGYHPITAQRGPSPQTIGSKDAETVYPLPTRLTKTIVRAALEYLDNDKSLRRLGTLDVSHARF